MAARDIAACDAIDVLTDSRFDVVDYVARYDALATKLDVDFSSIISALSGIPLCTGRDLHANQRQVVAKLIAQRQEATRAALPKLVARHFACFGRPGMHEIVEEAIIPCVQDVMFLLTGIQLPGDRRESLFSRVFSQVTGIAKRRRMETEVAALFDTARAHFPEEDEERLGARVALVILGYDASVGTIACSLHSLFDERPKLLSELKFEALPSHTGVPYVDRRALEEVDLAGHSWSEGDVARVCLKGFEAADHIADRHRLFGAGEHVCLGRPLFTAFWAEIGRVLRGFSTTGTLVSFELRKDDVFSFPSLFEVEVI